MHKHITISETLAMRMAEMAIASYLNTSLRIFVRPIFQEIDLQTTELPSCGGILNQSITLGVSFLDNRQLLRMGCVCYMQDKIGDGDWHPIYAQIYNENGAKLRKFKFDSAGNIS